MSMRSRFWWALLFALWLCTSPLAGQQQNSPPILPGSELLWSSLNQIALTLPNNFDSFMDSLTGQINSLQASNQSLQDSNAQLTLSNSSLTLRNADLQNSLQTSLQAEATSESKLSLLQTDLSASMQSTTRAEADAKALAVEIGILKVGLWIAVPVAAGETVYIVGHILGWWR